MQYPHVTEIARAGSGTPPFPRTQPELVALSLRVKPVRTVRPFVEHPRGIFR